MEDKLTFFGKVQNPLGILIVEEAVFKDGLSEVEAFFTRVENVCFEHFLNGWYVHWIFDDDIVIDQPSFLVLEGFSELIAVGVAAEEGENEIETFESLWGDGCLWGEDGWELEFGFEHQNLENFY
jgi:hypothetical protein